MHRANGDVPEDIIAGLGEMGAFGLSVPEQYGGWAGGGEHDYLGMVVATEELSRGSLGIGGSLITRPEILTRALVKGGTEAQKQEWLPKLATAEVMVAVAVTEPDYGSDVAGLKVTATPADGPDGEAGYVINGVKTWCTFAARADVLMLLARTNPDRSAAHRGLSLFIVPKERGDGHGFVLEQPGGGRMEGRPIDTLGYRGMHSYELAFDGWWVPAANLIGADEGLGRGFYLQMEGFENGRLQTAARALGVMQAAYEAALAYAGDRKVFGQPVGEYQLTQVKLARMGIIIQAARQFAYGVARVDGQGRGGHGGVHGEGLRLQGGGVGDARGAADPRRLRLRRGVPGEPALRRRLGAVHLRGRRRDAVPEGDRPAAELMRRLVGAEGAVPPQCGGGPSEHPLFERSESAPRRRRRNTAAARGRRS